MVKKNTNEKIIKFKMNKKKIVIMFVCLLMAMYVISLLVQLLIKPVKNVTVTNGKIYDEQSVEAYVIRDETVLNTNLLSDLNLFLLEGSKVAKDEVLAVYASKNKEQWEEKIKKLDIKIQSAMEEQSEMYSTDTKKIEIQIEDLVGKINATNQTQLAIQYKNEIDTLIEKKAKIAGELSPSGSYIKELIKERNEYESKLNETADYIKTTKSGIISTRIDNLENVFNIDKLYNITYSQLDGYKLGTDEMIPNNTKSIKIVDNYYCYLIINITDFHKDNIKVGDKVKVRLNYDNTNNIIAVIDKIVEEGNGKTIFLKITNAVEELVGYRKISMDIVWWEYDGLKVPTSAIKSDNYSDFVKLLKYGKEYVTRVKVLKTNNDYSIISNLTSEDMKKLGITAQDNREIMIYDQLVID